MVSFPNQTRAAPVVRTHAPEHLQSRRVFGVTMSKQKAKDACRLSASLAVYLPMIPICVRSWHGSLLRLLV